MKYLKKFERLDYQIQIGDYVICKENFIPSEDDEELFKETLEITSSNIGRYVKKDENANYLIIQYENIPEYLQEFFSSNDDIKNSRMMQYNEIKYASPKKENLIPILNDILIKKSASKFNL
jgi:hypothetical protein